MLKVLLVDDERIVVEGISSLVDWKRHQTTLIGTARNGLEAIRLMENDLPDIVITDIRMPGLDGLQLVEQAIQNGWDVRFIILSGYNEFDYAKTAMKYGVKHYLLKPCSEEQIMDALGKVAEEIRQERKKANFVQSIQERLDKVLPFAKEQFLKELITNKTYGKKEWGDYVKLFRSQLDVTNIQLALFMFEGEVEFEHMFALKNIAEDICGEELLKWSITIGDNVVLVLNETERHTLFKKIEQIREVFQQYYKIGTTVALSDPGEIYEIRKLYRDTLECIRYRFYLGEGSVITKKDISRVRGERRHEFDFDEEKLCLSLRTGNWPEAKRELSEFFQRLMALEEEQTVVKSYCIQLFLTMIREGGQAELERYYRDLVKFEQLDTIRQLAEFMEQVAEEIAAFNYDAAKSSHAKIAAQVKHIVDEHLFNPELSLSWISRNHLFMHPDYLGKLFREEYGEKFSSYVVRARVEQAKKRIEQSDDVKIFEIAEQIGFGNNPQYFSQVFKKYVGCTPSEYKKRFSFSDF